MSASNQVGAFNYAVPPFTKLLINNIAAAYTVVANDNGTVINCSGATSFTVSLTAAATLGAGFNVTVWNNTTTAAMAVTIDPSGSETIDGVTTRILRRGEGMQIVCDGTNWQTGDKKVMRGYAENLLSTDPRPVASGTGSVSVGQGATASGNGSFAIGGNSSITGLTTASGTGSLAIGGATAGANYSTAIGVNGVLGVGSVTATGTGSMALGGSYASGNDSFAAAIANNTSTYGAQGANAIAIGKLAKATSTESFAIGSGSVASSTSNIALGNKASATGAGSVVIAAGGTGWGSSATAGSSIAIGDGAVSNIVGKIAFASGSSNVNAGISQSGLFILSISTTDATASTLNSYNYGTSGSNNQVILPNNSAFAFTGTVVARRQAAGGTESAAWKVEGLIRREANAGTTTLVFSLVTAISNVPLWTLALSADTTNGGLAVTATGAAATNIRWVATIQTSEVTYA